MVLYEARDSIQLGGSQFERAQVVRLDSRWAAMLRYHLGSLFEDCFIPLSGETDSLLGNTMYVSDRSSRNMLHLLLTRFWSVRPLQGFVETTIKDLEQILHQEVSRFWSKDLITVQTDPVTSYNTATNSFTKPGEMLEIGDIVRLQINGDGRSYSWRVKQTGFGEPVKIHDLKVGEEYHLDATREKCMQPFLLEHIDRNSKVR